MKARASLLPAALVALLAGACAGPAGDTRYPPLPEGCDVKIFHESPSMMTENIGPVTATCGEDVGDADCLRTLKDQGCKLGADVIWGVSETPTKSAGKKQLSGRAAHSAAAGK